MKAQRVIARTKSEQNTSMVDPWTAVHAGTGLALGLLGVGFWKAVAGAVVYEFIEAQAETQEAGRRFFRVSAPEVFSNQVIDVIVFAYGVRLGHRWNATK